LLSFRRITSGGAYIPQVDGLRFMAIASVLILHALLQVRDAGPRVLVFRPWTDKLIFAVENGDRGVLLFFVISGYILGRPFLRQHRLNGKKVKLGAYFLRRLTRLEPPFILSLLIYTLAYRFGYHRPFGPMMPHLAASLAYAHNLVFNGRSTINPVIWTLEIEVQFYILAPLLGYLFAISNMPIRRLTIAGLMVASSALSGLLTTYEHRSLFGFAHYFLAGFLLADLLDYPASTDTTYGAWDFVSLIGWPLLFIPRGTAVTEFWMPPLLILLCLAAFHGKASRWFFRRRFIALTGGMCYSIYLMHRLAFEVASRAVRYFHMAGDGTTALLQMALLLAFALPACAVYFLLVERPCMDPRWPAKLAATLTGTANPTQAESL
jgi:peptidoglycan/LPS O-acetylase OafA/YrhL